MIYRKDCVMRTVLNDGVYTCKVTNVLGNDTRNTSIGKFGLRDKTFYSTKKHRRTGRSGGRGGGGGVVRKN